MATPVAETNHLTNRFVSVGDHRYVLLMYPAGPPISFLIWLANVDAMALAWFKATVPVLVAVAWPLFLLALALIFRRPLIYLIANIRHAKGPGIDLWWGDISTVARSAEETAESAATEPTPADDLHSAPPASAADSDISPEPEPDPDPDPDPHPEFEAESQQKRRLDAEVTRERAEIKRRRSVAMEEEAAAQLRAAHNAASTLPPLNSVPGQFSGEGTLQASDLLWRYTEDTLPPTVFSQWVQAVSRVRLGNPEYAILSGFDGFARWLRRYLAARWKTTLPPSPDEPLERVWIAAVHAGLIREPARDGLSALTRMRNYVAHGRLEPTAAMAADYLDAADRLSRAIEASGPKAERELPPEPFLSS
jgi:hypothetical protein